MGLNENPQVAAKMKELANEQTIQDAMEGLRQGVDTRAVDTKLANTAVQEVNENPDAVEKKVRSFSGEKLIGNLTTLHAENVTQIEGKEGLRARLQGYTTPDIVNEDRLSAILDSLTEPPPLYGDALQRGEYRYLRYRAAGDPEDVMHVYEVKLQDIRNDQKYLDDLKTSQPIERHADIDKVKAMLEKYMQADRQRLALYEWEQKKDNNYTDRAIGKMGKMTLLILLAAGAVLTGIMMIANKKFSAAPFLYAGVAGLIASKKLRTAIFGTKYESMMLEINGALGPGFQRLAKEYGVQGESWGNFTEDIQKKSTYINDFLKKHDGNVVPDTEIATFVEEAFGDKASDADRANLTQMIKKNQLGSFVMQIRKAGGQDAQGVVYDYVRIGAGKFAKDMNTLSGATEKAEANAQNVQSKLG